MTTLRFHNLDSLDGTTPPTSASSNAIIVGKTKADVEEVPLVALQVIGLTSDSIPLFKAAALRLSPSKDAPSSVSFLAGGGTGGNLSNIVVAALPSVCSRNNTPSFAHSVSKIVKDNRGTGDLAVVLLTENTNEAYAQALAIARCFPTFSMKKSSGDAVKDDIVSIYLHAGLGEGAELLQTEIEQLSSNIRLAAHLVDMPPCKLHCSLYVDKCREIQKELEPFGVAIKVIRGKELDEGGFGGIYGVGKASDHDPALVILSHVPQASTPNAKSICLVGKGIVYDTGGLSIKVPPGMNTMKTDMAGSAAVLGAFIATVRVGGLGRPLHALLCIAENSVDSRAMRPDDVLTMLSGLSVEINNTDAEGRLVLADGVHYAATRLNPALIVDIATLTGAQLVTTGKKHAAVYCSHPELESLSVDCGKYTGDLCFPMLYCPEMHRQEFKSTIADMRNSVADRMNAQSSCAAAFIGNHIEQYLDAGGHWVHVDCAGPATAGDRATGFGVALLFDMARKFEG